MTIDVSLAEKEQYYDYVVTATIAAASGNVMQTLTLDQDSYFELIRFQCTSSKDVKTDFQDNNFTVVIANANGRQWSNAAVAALLMGGGSAGIGRFLPRPVFIKPNTTLSFTFTDLSAATNNAVTLILSGVKHLI